MTKKKKTIIISIIILMPLFIFIADFGVQSCVVMNYLCQKYDANVTDFKLVKYTPEHTKDMTLVTSVLFDHRRMSPLWEYEYNDRIFNVQRYDKHSFSYFDDYQIEDISKWTTEYLQKNIDKNIIDCSVSTEGIKYLSGKYEYYRLNPVKESDIEKYLELDGVCHVYYMSDVELPKNMEYQLEDSFDKNTNDKYVVRIIGFKPSSEPIERHHKDFLFGEINSYYYIDDSCYLFF